MSKLNMPNVEYTGAGMDAESGRTVLITGAAGGLGRAFALGFAGRGYRVAVADINLEGAEQTAKLVRELGAEAAAFAADVTSVDSTENLAKSCADFGNGSIDVVINNVRWVMKGGAVVVDKTKKQ